MLHRPFDSGRAPPVAIALGEMPSAPVDQSKQTSQRLGAPRRRRRKTDAEGAENATPSANPPQPATRVGARARG